MMVWFRSRGVGVDNGVVGCSDNFSTWELVLNHVGFQLSCERVGGKVAVGM